MVSAEILCRAIIHDVCTIFQRSLQVRAHHSVIDYDESIWSTLLDLGSNGREISNLEERVGGALQKNHGSFSRCSVLVKIDRVSSVNMVHDDAAMSFEIDE